MNHLCNTPLHSTHFSLYSRALAKPRLGIYFFPGTNETSSTGSKENLLTLLHRNINHFVYDVAERKF